MGSATVGSSSSAECRRRSRPLFEGHDSRVCSIEQISEIPICYHRVPSVDTGVPILGDSSLATLRSKDEVEQWIIRRTRTARQTLLLVRNLLVPTACLVGLETIFFYATCPMFMSPHDYQVILEGTLSNQGSDPQRTYREGL